MVKLSDIIEKITDIELRTLSVPSHVLVSKKTAQDLVDQYLELLKSDADMVYQSDDSCDLQDVGDFLGVSIVISLYRLDGFKVLEEIKTHT
jgi:hypothetical protein